MGYRKHTFFTRTQRDQNLKDKKEIYHANTNPKLFSKVLAKIKITSVDKDVEKPNPRDAIP